MTLSASTQRQAARRDMIVADRAAANAEGVR